MADGSTYQTPEPGCGDARLMRATAGRRSLWARCGCGRQAIVDPGPWLAQGLGRQPVQQLEERLRCVCGARRVRLEIRGLSEAPPGGGGGIYVFR